MLVAVDLALFTGCNEQLVVCNGLRRLAARDQDFEMGF